MTYTFRYDHESGAFYIRVREGEYAETVDLVGPGFGAYMDVDQEGNVLGFEFLSFEEFAEFIERNDGNVEIPERVRETAVFRWSSAENRPEVQGLRDALESLPFEEQEVLRQRYMEGLTTSDMAERKGTSVAEVVQDIHTALRALKRALGTVPEDKEDSSLEEALTRIA